MYAERQARGIIGDPPCDTCRVELLPENAEAGQIYFTCRGQVVTEGMGEVIDINHVALWQAIDRYKVQEPLRVFELVNKVFHHFLAKEKDKSGTD